MANKDTDLFEEIKTHASDIKSQYTKRNTEFEEYERMYLMTSSEGQRGQGLLLGVTDLEALRLLFGNIVTLCLFGFRGFLLFRLLFDGFLLGVHVGSDGVFQGIVLIVSIFFFAHDMCVLLLFSILR